MPRDNEEVEIRKFAENLVAHAVQKLELYNGVKRNLTPERRIVLAAEELGEVASAFVRERYDLAIAECVDLAHTAMLIAFSIQNRGS